jgi:hypothetical protein
MSAKNSEPGLPQAILDILKRIEGIRDDFRAIGREDIGELQALQATWEIIGQLAYHLSEAGAEIALLTESQEPKE